MELIASTLQHPGGMHAPAAVPGEQFDHKTLPQGMLRAMMVSQNRSFVGEQTFPVIGGVAVELMASTLQHPQGMHAPAAVPGEQFDQDSLPLGPVPHMIRGQLSGFSQMCLTGQAFQQCTACSPTVVQQYKQHGWSFLQQALQVNSFWIHM